jgi:HD-GYP domain-containing protein (c-di-GMP phosphodiesterase class II)
LLLYTDSYTLSNITLTDINRHNSLNRDVGTDMRLISITKCQPGMRLGKPIYNEDGRVLLGAQVELTNSLIRRLVEYGTSYVYIVDSRTDDIIVPDMISDETRIKAMAQIRSTFKTLMDQSNRKKAVGNLDKDFRQVLHMIIDDLSSHKDAMIMLMNMSVTDHYLFQHSMNVCVYTCMLGMHKGYNRNDLMTLGLGALLHDIGKTQVPADILLKKSKLTTSEFDLIKTHTDIGYRLLKDETSFPLLTAHCALQHHERIDGSGYPRGIKGKEIHEFAQWIGLVDSYDAMTTHRVYRDTLLPHQAMEIIFTGAGTLFEQEKIETFRDRVALYPLGVTVKLHSGESGIVVDINSASPQRPVVRIFEDPLGEQLKEPYEIDLSKHLSTMIVGINEME